MGVMVRHSRTLRSCLGVLAALVLLLPAMAQDAADSSVRTTRPVDVSDAPTSERQPEGFDRLKRGLGDVSAGSQQILDRVNDELRGKWLSDDGKIKAVVVEADGEVDNFMRDSIKSRFETAKQLGAEVVILKLDTYGGLVTAGLDISRFIKQYDVYTICFVDDKAISAGAMIALACDEIVMEPATLIGDCGVIAVGPNGVQSMGDTERAKQESPVLADFDDSARRNGYSPILARAFVLLGQDVYYIENTDTGDRKFVDGREYERLVNGGAFRAAETPWQPVPDVPVPLDGEKGLLTLSEINARQIGLSTGTFADVNALAAERGWTVAAVLTPSGGERLVGFLGSYAVRGLLMTVLFFGIYMSFSHPGTGAPEALTALVATVLFAVPALTGYAQWYEVILVLLGVALLAVEVFVTPGFGVAGITGLVMLLLGLALTFVAPLAPPDLPLGTGVDWNSLGYGLLTVVAGLVSSLMLWFWLSRYLVQLPYFNKLILTDTVPASPREEAEQIARTAAWPTVGMVGLAVSDLRPGGTASFGITDAPGDTANADVICDRGFVPAGTPLSVVEVAGNRTVVRPAE